MTAAKKWKFFVGSCILAAGLLLLAGAPIVPTTASDWRTKEAKVRWCSSEF